MKVEHVFSKVLRTNMFYIYNGAIVFKVNKRHCDPRLKILPGSHSAATWCIMVNVSMWCLPTTAHKEWCAKYYYRNDKESYTFQRQNLFILQHGVHTNIS